MVLKLCTPSIIQGNRVFALTISSMRRVSEKRTFEVIVPYEGRKESTGGLESMKRKRGANR